MNESIDGYPFRFACRRSGNCCSIPDGVVRVTDRDIVAIANHLGMSESAVRSRYVQPSGDRLRDGEGSRCIFLMGGRESACEIYPVRPSRCRSWPYWPELRDNPAALERAKRLCPGIVDRPAAQGGPP